MAYEQDVKRREAFWRGTKKLQRILIRRNDGWASRSLVQSHPLLVTAMLNGDLRVDMTRLPLFACEEAQAAKVRLHGKEGDDHARLKHAALAWMADEGAKDAQAEVRMGGWIADAYSEEYIWAIECGNTDASRLMDAIRWNRAPRFTVIPFQSTHWPNERVRRLIAVDFYWRPSLTQWVVDQEVIQLRSCAEALDYGYLRGKTAEQAQKDRRERQIAEAQARKAEREAAALRAKAGEEFVLAFKRRAV